MAEEGKKISFGFAKSIKKTVLKNTVPQEEKKVDYIECLDEKGIKVIGETEKKDEPLIIPLLGSKTWHDRIVNKIDADIFESKTIKIKTEHDTVEEKKPEVSNGKISPKADIADVKIKTEPADSDENNVSTLEEQAAKEIIAELKDSDKKEAEPNVFALPLAENQSLRGEDQSTLDDYEKIPVDAFGIAMLRGMGWQPGKGIGKNEKIVPAVIPELRPKGMGLGADKVTSQKQNQNSKKPEEELKIEKGTFVKVIAGKQSGNYGQIEGFDDDAGRLIVKLALGGNTVSLNEFMVQPVTKSDYLKNGKVLNAKKYEEYKDKEVNEGKVKETKKRVSSESLDSSDSDSNIKERQKEIDRNKMHRSREKKAKSRKRHSDYDSDSDSDYGKRTKRRSRSSSRDSYKSKKTKKSKKNKRHDSSPERSSKKHKKKDKEREKTRDKKSRESEHTDRRKHKKRGRSRSR